MNGTKKEQKDDTLFVSMTTIPELDERLKKDYYETSLGLLVFTERFHLNRGFCCGNRCRHCPYEPTAKKGNTKVANHLRKRGSVAPQQV